VISLTPKTALYHAIGIEESQGLHCSITGILSKKLDIKNIAFLVVAMPFIQPLPSAISELFLQSSLSGKITLADRYGLLAALLNESISEDEIHCIDRLLYSLRRGRVQIVDELSMSL